MMELLIADKDVDACNQMADLFTESGYDVTVENSALNVLSEILKGKAEVLLLGSELNDVKAGDLVPLLKKCNRNLVIILVSDDTPLPLIRKFRKEGIFYHALRPIEPEDRKEIREVVECAFKNLLNTRPRRNQGYNN
jgi:DNA-binding NtrC family response regulator